MTSFTKCDATTKKRVTYRWKVKVELIDRKFSVHITTLITCCVIKVCFLWFKLGYVQIGHDHAVYINPTHLSLCTFRIFLLIHCTSAWLYIFLPISADWAYVHFFLILTFLPHYLLFHKKFAWARFRTFTKLLWRSAGTWATKSQNSRSTNWNITS